ncbi:peptidase domain-containing ABC transporter [Roseibium sp.]|uniref:peptidase domain-containing ABC transporter n=1 Tax=Roseibium sp. TaxID=1936156 RepID=UPI003A96B325
MSLSAFTSDTPIRPGSPSAAEPADLETRLHEHSSGNGPISAAEACILPLLKALRWDGLERHLFEALPHLEPVQTIYELRAVLTRLNYQTDRKIRRLGSMTAENLPCLLATKDNIYVCLNQTGEGYMRAYSGAEQKEVLLPLSQSGETFLIDQLGQSFKSSAQFKHWSSRLFHQFRGTLVRIFVVGLLTNMLALALPLFVMTVYDKAMGAKSIPVLVTLLIGIALIFVLDGLTKITKSRLQAYFGTRLDSVIANTTFRHFLHLPLPLTVNAPIGSQITRLRQFEGVRDIFHGNLANALINLPFSAIFVVTLAIIGGKLALLPAGLLLCYTLAAFVLVPRMKQAINVTGEAKSRLQNLTVESLHKTKEIRGLSANEIWLDKYRNVYAEFARKNLHTRMFSTVMQILSQTSMTACGIGVLALGAVQVIDGNLTPGALIAVMALSWRSLNPMHQAFLSLTQLGLAQQAIERINGLLKIPLEREPGALPSLQRSLQGTLRMSSLVLRYPGRQEPALRNLTLAVEKGEVLAVTGPSGSGKTTLIRALLGLYRPQMGAILVDNLDTRQLDPGEWRYCIGYAPDDYDFFYGTIAQNLRMADPQADQQQLLECFSEFGLDEYTDLLPEGLETRLTAGLLQRVPDNVKQRILLARAFLRPAPIYLLDNPAGNLDRDGDRLLMEKIERVRGHSTVIMTTYRPSHMKMAENVAYLQNGQVSIYGPPGEVLDEIMQKN